jgi:hypothetical protein
MLYKTITQILSNELGDQSFIQTHNYVVFYLHHLIINK